MFGEYDAGRRVGAGRRQDRKVREELDNPPTRGERTLSPGRRVRPKR